MQGLTIDTLASKRIPAASKMSSLPRLVAEYATRAIRPGRDGHAAVASAPAAKAATQRSAALVVASSIQLEQSRTYVGYVPVSGPLSATSNQSGTWSGTLKDTMYLTVDSSGNGTGYETFSGNVTLNVTNPDGSHKSQTAPLTFETPDFTLQGGKFSFSQSSGFDFSGLFLTLNLGGSFGATQATISSNLALPFSGFVNDVAVSGSINAAGLITDHTPLTISGAASRQTATAAKKMTPFNNLVITDLNATTVTATVTLSNAAHGTLTNLAGGKYNRATGVYTITGGGAVVNRALEGLLFDPVGNLNLSSRHVATGFTLKVTDGKGASLTNRMTSVIATNPLYINGVSAHQSTTGTKVIAPFRYVTVNDFSEGGGVDFVRVILSNPQNGTLENLSGGFYSKKNGVYTIKASAAAITSALRGLKFVPTASSGSAVTTTFKISMTDTDGASITNNNTTVIDNPAAPASAVKTAVALFSQYVASGLHTMPDHAAGIFALHDLPQSSHLEFAGSHR
jgi:hypothetical protein